MMVPLVASPDLHDGTLSRRFPSAPPHADSENRIYKHGTAREARHLHSTQALAPLEDKTPIDAVPPPPPEPSTLTLLTPRDENCPDLASVQFQQSLDLPASPGTGPPLIPRPTRTLRLPPFDALGIALPTTNSQLTPIDTSLASAILDHADKGVDGPHPRQSSLPGIAEFPPSPKSDAIHRSNPGPLQSGFRAVRNFVLTHTPPDDSGTIDWGNPQVDTTEGASQEPSARQQASPSITLGVTSDSIRASTLGMADQLGFGLAPGRAPWLADALSSILDIVHQHNTSDAIKILSHALPSPSADGHAFPVVIESIQQSTSSTSIMWMNVWHAVSGRFKFEDLPKSPPTTPAPPFEGDDYFTQRVFDYAVEVPDYSQKLTAQPLTPRPQRPAIAPNSIDISIVERFIPPTSTAEFEELFSATGRSFLNDRLIELSPAHGTLLFIYPTKAGGETFRKDYLDPILAPTLRSIMTMNDLPQNLAEAVGNMDAIANLPSFDDMRSQLRTFLNTLSNGGGSTPNRFRLQSSMYELMYASPQEVRLERSVWAKDWWTKQEKLRIQRAFEQHDVQSATRTRQAGAFQASEHLVTATLEAHHAAQHNQAQLIQRAQTQALLREAERSRGERNPGDNERLILRLMDEVKTKEYRNGPPESGIEVGVFVIQKRPRT